MMEYKQEERKERIKELLEMIRSKEWGINDKNKILALFSLKIGCSASKAKDYYDTLINAEEVFEHAEVGIYAKPSN